jgi:hypothetical protein
MDEEYLRDETTTFSRFSTSEFSQSEDRSLTPGFGHKNVFMAHETATTSEVPPGYQAGTSYAQPPHGGDGGENLDGHVVTNSIKEVFGEALTTPIENINDLTIDALDAKRLELLTQAQNIVEIASRAEEKRAEFEAFIAEIR